VHQVQDAWNGRVPQVDVWIDAWAQCNVRMSFRSQEALQEQHSRQEGCVRKQRRKLVAIIAEVVRCRMRAELRGATSIALAVDGKGTRKVVRYRCDTAANVAMDAAAG
jgi:hypothetical protein